jgi:CHAT domain-containing protein
MAPDALVVLSSCDSSVGNSIGGVGVRGLTSAFLIAGAGAVVGSLWPVESSATADLMLEFHQYVAGGMPIAEALRQAQLTMMAEQSHPYYWSAFNVTGNRAALLPASFVDTVTATAALYR